MTCYQPADKTQPRMLRDRHGEECPARLAETATGATHSPSPGVSATDVISGAQIGAQCPGCQPCPEDHCHCCGHRHAPVTCTTCVSDTRDDLREVKRLAGLPLLEEALSKGVRSEAADMLGPSANPHQWRQRGRYGHRYDADARLGELEPYTLLGQYDLLVTAHLGHMRTGRITVDRAVDYLDRNLAHLAADMEFDFADLADNLRDCRAHLESVLREGEQCDTGAPCMSCAVPLRFVYAGRNLPWSDTSKAREDGWCCPRCRRWHNTDQYRLAVKAEALDRAEWLTVEDVTERTEVKAWTVRKWSQRGHVRQRIDSGRVVFNVNDVEARRASVSNDGAA